MKRLFRDKFSLLCIILGAALVLGAGAMLIMTKVTQSSARKDAALILEKVQSVMPQPVQRVPEERGNNAMASMQVDGVNIVGVLELPQYGRTLPVSSGWDTGLVSSMPCRFTGSIYDRSLIIGAADGEGQLSFASQLEVGTQIHLTDMEGGRYTYQVAAIHHAKHATLEKLQSGDYALTIFVKNSKTGDYLLIRCQTNA